MDLSSDSKATVEKSLLPPKQVPINRIITKLFMKHHCDVGITGPFAIGIHFKGKCFLSLGGGGRSRTLKCNWTVTLTEQEIVPYVNDNGKKDTTVIISSKRKCEDLK